MFSFVVPLICHLSILLWRGLWAEQLDHPTKMSTPPLGLPPPLPVPQDVQTAETKPKKKKKAVVPDIDEKNKKLQIEISESDKASCNAFVHKQTARRGRPFMKNQGPDRKTSAQIKKQDEIKQEPQEQIEIVKEDCHVQVDDSSYGDWLLTQGIDLSMSPPGAAPIVISLQSSDADKQAMSMENMSKEIDMQNIEVVQKK